MDKSSFQFVAEAFHEYNITTFLVTYPLAPSASMDEIVESSRTALAWIYKNCHQFNGDPNQLYVAGYSAGGHLASMLLSGDWPSNHNLPADTIKGTCVMSGLFNLIPIHLSDINEMLLMDYETAVRNSPVQNECFSPSPLLMAVGENETAEFKEQTKELYESWKGRLPVEYLQVPGANHFSIIEEFTDKRSPLHRSMLDLMNT
jgi:arylformamidase